MQENRKIVKVENRKIGKVENRKIGEQEKQNQEIIIQGREATFTRTVSKEDIEDTLNEISIGEDKEDVRRKAKIHAQANWSKYQKEKVPNPTDDCPRLCCHICEALLGAGYLPAF